MKKLIIPSLFLALSNMLAAQEFNFHYNTHFDSILKLSQDETNPLYYPILLQQYLENEQDLSDFEMLALMIGYTKNEHYKPYADVETEREIYRLNGEGDFKKALALAIAFNETHPLNQMTLIELSYCHYKLGNQEQQDLYMRRYKKVMNAMHHSGVGNHIDSALFSLTPIDGQNFISKFLGLEIGSMGSGKDKYGNFIDILQAVTEEDASFTLYFNIEHAMEDLSRMLEEAEKSESEDLLEIDKKGRVKRIKKN